MTEMVFFSADVRQSNIAYSVVHVKLFKKKKSRGVLLYSDGRDDRRTISTFVDQTHIHRTRPRGKTGFFQN